MTQPIAFSTKEIRKLGKVDGYKSRQKVLEAELRTLGADRYDLLLPETHALPLLLQNEERLLGIVCGRYKQTENDAQGRGALVATNSRVLLIDKKPLYMRYEELPYYNISAITYSRVGPSGVVTLYSRVGSINIHTLNQTCAQIFVRAIEEHILVPGVNQQQTQLSFPGSTPIH